VRAVSSGDGAFSTVAPTGEYAVTTESQAGLAVGQAPVKVAVADGRVASADVELVAVASAVTQDPAAVPPPQDPAAPASDPQVPADPQAPAASAWATTSGTGAQSGLISWPVTTRNTPGRRAAAEVSIPRMRAWAWGLRTNAT